MRLLVGLAAGAAVLDLGCGCGVPVARQLTKSGHDVTGVDFSAVQIDRAHRLVPGARSLQADITEIEFPAGSFDAVVCLYTLIHLPDTAQRAVLSSIRRWLRPGGMLVATVGATAWNGTDPDWLGAGAPMWWNHPDVTTYRRWTTQAGLRLEYDQYVPEGDHGHQLLVAAAPARAGG